MITGHGGNISALAERLGCSVNDITDMSSNLNPLGPPEGLEAFIRENLFEIRRLPQADAADMVAAFSRYHDVNPSRVMAGNGTTWFIYTLPAALSSQKTLILGPTYSDYRDGCLMNGSEVVYCNSGPDSGFNPDPENVVSAIDAGSGVDTVVICNPNNPTGALMAKEDILGIVSSHPEIAFVVDESYLPFVPGAETLSLVGETRYENLAVLSSMSKIYTIPGLRTGFVCAHPKVIDRLKERYQPWSVNSLAQAAVVYLFERASEIRPFIRETRAFVEKERQRFVSSLEAHSHMTLYPASTYFLLAELRGRMRSHEVVAAVGDHRILIRDCENFEGLTDRFVRFSLKTREANQRLVDVLNRVVE